MILKSWRFIGVSAFIIIYIGGVLFLSLNNAPGTHPQRFSNFRNTRLMRFSGKVTIHWCTKLKYLNRTLPSRTADTATPRLSVHTGSTAKSPDTKREYYVERPTALASFPGSGNTWLRYLLQQATGILTGSVYLDPGLVKTGFPAESVLNNSVLIVKIHETGPEAWWPFERAILLVRDPSEAILAEFNRRSGGHVGFAPPDCYKRKNGKFWQKFVSNQVKSWVNLNLKWAQAFQDSLKIVFYEDLVNDVEMTLRGILNFLDYPINETLLQCALQRKEGVFRRKKRILPFDPYTPAMRALLEEKKRLVYAELRRYH